MTLIQTQDQRRGQATDQRANAQHLLGLAKSVAVSLFFGQAPCSQLPSGALFFFGRVPLKVNPPKKGCPFFPGHWASECGPVVLFWGGEAKMVVLLLVANQKGVPSTKKHTPICFECIDALCRQSWLWGRWALTAWLLRRRHLSPLRAFSKSRELGSCGSFVHFCPVHAIIHSVHAIIHSVHASISSLVSLCICRIWRGWCRLAHRSLGQFCVQFVQRTT